MGTLGVSGASNEVGAVFAFGVSLLAGVGPASKAIFL